MRIFLDTNVLASAAATRGLCADVMREVLAFHELVVSRHLLEELERILRTKFGVRKDLVGEMIGLLQQDAIMAEHGSVPHVNLRDKDDLPILASVLSGKADVLVTGDKELLALRRIEHTEILSPRQLWEKLTAREGR